MMSSCGQKEGLENISDQFLSGKRESRYVDQWPKKKIKKKRRRRRKEELAFIDCSWF